MHWRTLFVKAKRHLPERVTQVLDPLATWLFSLSERLKIRRVLRSGPPFQPSHKAVIIDVTTLCNRHCVDCNRSVGHEQAMVREHMSLAQIEKFVAESIACGRRWERIDIEGGEPTLHPDIFGILECLVAYRDRYSPGTNIRVLTNGYGDKAEEVISRLPELGIDLYNSRKTTREQEGHCAFNIAPCDQESSREEDFSQGCHLPAVYGLGLTRHGYYPHPVCGGIDRVFGLDMGRKKLPGADEAMTEQYASLCRYCGFFLYSKRMQNGQKHFSPPESDRGRKTVSWQRAYSEYQKKKPDLTLY